MSIETIGSAELDLTGHESIEKFQPSFWQQVFQEARSVSVWFAASTFFRVVAEVLMDFASYRTECGGESQCNSLVPKDAMMKISFFTMWVLRAFPYKLSQGAAPGFIYACPWILMMTRNVFGSFPNFPLRIAEGVLGRLSLPLLSVVVIVHFACAVSTSFILRYLIPAEAYPLAFDLIEYSNGSPRLLVSAAFNDAVNRR